MNDKPFLTIAEYAKFEGVSPQSVYKRLNNPKSNLQPFLVEVEFTDGKTKKMLKSEVITALKEEPKPKSVISSSMPNSNNPDDKVITALIAQLEVKDREISRLHDEIDRLQTSFDHSQQLLALQLATGKTEAEPQPQTEDAPQADDELQKSEGRLRAWMRKLR